MVRRSSSILLFIASLAAAQSFEKLLPAGARIIETVDVSGIAKKPRVLMLWMINPERHVGNPESRHCGDEVHGDFWSGPTRLSLVDSRQGKILNTIKITLDPDRAKDVGDQFWIPFRVSNTYYTIPHPDKESWGAPRLLDLRDLTGEGVAAEFPLFIYDVCGLATGGVFGYSMVLDSATQYSVLRLPKDEKPEIAEWVQQVFSAKPLSPGHWEFTWGPGHGVDDLIDEDVTFDRVKQRFVERYNVRQPR